MDVGNYLLFVYVVLQAVTTTEMQPNRTKVCKPRIVTCVCRSESAKSSDSRHISVPSSSCARDWSVCEHLKGQCSHAESVGELQRRRSSGYNGECAPYLNKDAPPGPPRIALLSASTIDLDVDELLEIECKVLSNYSNPEVHVYWLFKGGSINNYPGFITDQKIGCRYTLTKTPIHKDDEGKYTCVANNSLGSSNQTATVIVKLPPPPSVKEFGIEDGMKVAYLGSTINLTCTVDVGSMNGGLSCFLRHRRIVHDGGRYLNTPDRFGSLVTGKLTISNVSQDDQGAWVCYGLRNGLNTNKTFYLKTVPCPAGYFCPLGLSQPKPCPYGHYSDGTRNTTYECTECPGDVPSKSPDEYGPAKSVDECPQPTETTPTSKSNNLWFLALLAVLIGVVPVFLWYKRRHLRHHFRLNDLELDTPLNDVDISSCSWEGTVAGPSSGNHGNLCNGYHSNGVVKPQDEVLQQSEDCAEYPALHDVFICYSSKDSKFAKEIQVELEKLGYKCCIDWRDFTPGEAVVVNIANAIYHSKNTLALLSPDFLSSEYCKHELYQALNRSIRHHKVIPILYRTCEVPIELRHKTYIDYVNCYVKPHFWYQLKKALGDSVFDSGSVTRTSV